MTMREILIIRLSSIGDVMHCTPVARSLKAAWPDCRVTWLVGEVCADLLRYNPHVDEVLVWSRERFERLLRDRDFGEALRMWRRLRDSLSPRRYWAVLDVHGLFLTGVIARLAAADRRVGMSDARELNPLFMTETAKPLGEYVTDRYLGVLRPLGIARVDATTTLVVPGEAEQFAERFLGIRTTGDRRFAVLVPGTTWPAKNWPAPFFAETARLLGGDFTVVLCGSRAEARVGEEIEAATGVRVVNAINRTRLLEMGGIMKKAAVVVAGDTGPLYMAAALGVPTVGIYGPTDPARLAPRGSRHAALWAGQPCSFCNRMRCPAGSGACLQAVTPYDVARAAYRVSSLAPGTVRYGPPAREGAVRRPLVSRL